jgi:hypothetical protein
MSLGIRLRALFIVLVAGGAIWIYMAGRADVREMRDPNFSTPTPPVLAEIPLDAELVLEGRLRTNSGEPLADASVVVSANGLPHWALSDVAGRFRIDGLPAGEHELNVLVFEHAPQSFRVTLPSTELVELQLAPPRPPLETLPEVARKTLRGVLLAAAGSASAGAEIWLEPAVGTDWLTGVLPRRARADAAGRFVFEDLALGSYTARVLPAWASGGSWPVLERTEWTFDGTQVEWPLDYRPAHIELSVVDANGAALQGVLALLRESGDAQRGWPGVVSDAQGRLAYHDLASGEYELELIAGKARELRSFHVAVGEHSSLGLVPLAP